MVPQSASLNSLCAVRRVAVIGCCGSGKSFLARKLANKLKLPLVQLDDHYWDQEWRRPSEENWRARVVEMSAAPCWIIDGNYTETLEPRLSRAELVVFLDLPLWLCWWRVFRRDVRRFREGKRHVRIWSSAVRQASTRRVTCWLHVLRFNRTERPRMLELL